MRHSTHINKAKVGADELLLALQGLEENALTKGVLMPLFTALGYGGVEYQIGRASCRERV